MVMVGRCCICATGEEAKGCHGCANRVPVSWKMNFSPMDYSVSRSQTTSTSQPGGVGLTDMTIQRDYPDISNVGNDTSLVRFRLGPFELMEGDNEYVYPCVWGFIEGEAWSGRFHDGFLGGGNVEDNPPSTQVEAEYVIYDSFNISQDPINWYSTGPYPQWCETLFTIQSRPGTNDNYFRNYPTGIGFSTARGEKTKSDGSSFPFATSFVPGTGIADSFKERHDWSHWASSFMYVPAEEETPPRRYGFSAVQDPISRLWSIHYEYHHWEGGGYRIDWLEDPDPPDTHLIHDEVEPFGEQAKEAITQEHVESHFDTSRLSSLDHPCFRKYGGGYTPVGFYDDSVPWMVYRQRGTGTRQRGGTNAADWGAALGTGWEDSNGVLQPRDFSRAMGMAGNLHVVNLGPDPRPPYKDHYDFWVKWMDSDPDAKVCDIENPGGMSDCKPPDHYKLELTLQWRGRFLQAWHNRHPTYSNSYLDLVHGGYMNDHDLLPPDDSSPDFVGDPTGAIGNRDHPVTATTDPGILLPEQIGGHSHIGDGKPPGGGFHTFSWNESLNTVIGSLLPGCSSVGEYTKVGQVGGSWSKIIDCDTDFDGSPVTLTRDEGAGYENTWYRNSVINIPHEINITPVFEPSE